MKKIKMPSGQTFFIDEDDWEWAENYSWHLAFKYVRTSNYKGKTAALHRIIMNIDSKQNVQCDHINGNKLDNRKCNLRICSAIQNQRNLKLRKDSKSGFKGVSWHKKDKKWRARIKIGPDNQLYLGNFVDPKIAALAYDEAAKKYFGEFANLNFPRGDNNGSTDNELRIDPDHQIKEPDSSRDSK